MMDVEHVTQSVVYTATLPLEANVLFMTVIATKMPFAGRDEVSIGKCPGRRQRGQQNPSELHWDRQALLQEKQPTSEARAPCQQAFHTRLIPACRSAYRWINDLRQIAPGA
jgi:hypothetical protein